VGVPIAGLYELLACSAREDAGRVALIDPVARRTLTYGELDALARAHAQQLVDAGVRTGDRVALVLDKSFDAVAWIYGVLAAGAAYVPIDPHAPAARIEHLLADSGARGVVHIDGGRVTWSTRQASGEPTPGAAYLLYTSGSTGQPKATVHTHAGALAFLDAFSQLLAPEPADCFSCHPPYHFDMSTLDLFLSVKHGARAVLFAQDTGRLAPALARIIEDHRITIWWSVPTALRLLLQFGRLERRSGWMLRHVMFAGEPLLPVEARKLQQHWPGARLYNVYGCTETNNTTMFELPSPVPAERGEPFPIGTAVPGITTAVVDRELRDVPPGSEGELLVAGASLMTGYWNDPDRTAAALVSRDGLIWYRTGDLVRCDAHGDLVLLGRADRMVKRRGYRIELAELERCLAEHADLAEVAVVADKRAPEVTIHAYFVTRRPTSADALATFLIDRLPTYMLPDTFTALDEVPKTSTGKIDYQALLARRDTLT
jgi:amino acid adenylation domain-containing protein